MFYRQKVFLGLLEACGGSLSNTDFEKLLFLYCQRTGENHYDFFPYKYGGFSFISYYDKRKLTDAGYLLDVDRFKLAESTRSFLSQLKQTDKEKIRVFAYQTRKLRGKDLVREVYEEYPKFASRSEIVSEVLTESAYSRVRSQWDSSGLAPVLFTIGYEGLSIDAYIFRLIESNATALVDVRKNPISRKFGFSKKTLSNYVMKAGLHYYHLPELGIPSHLRKNLDSNESYNSLFSFYESQILPYQDEALKNLKRIAQQHNRIALTCYEADHTLCHRHKLVESLQNELSSSYRITHL